MSRRTIALFTVSLLLLVGLFLLSYFGPGDTERGQVLTVQLQWEPSAQFLGFYAAKEEGYYADQGFDVRFLHGGPNVDPIANIINGNAEIGLATADQVLRWNDQHPMERLKAVGTVFDRSLAVFMVRADSGITQPSDFAGKRVGVFPSYDTESLMQLLLRKGDVDFKSVTQVNFPNFANFENGDIDIYGAYIINEPQLAALRGIKVQLIDPATYGIYFYSDTVIAREDYLTVHADTVSKFIAASSRGWKFSEGNLEAALHDMRTEVGGVFGAGEPWQHQELAAKEAIRYLRGGQQNLLTMRPDTWGHLAEDLKSIGVLSRENIVDETCDYAVADAANEYILKAKGQ